MLTTQIATGWALFFGLLMVNAAINMMMERKIAGRLLPKWQFCLLTCFTTGMSYVLIGLVLGFCWMLVTLTVSPLSSDFLIWLFQALTAPMIQIWGWITN